LEGRQIHEAIGVAQEVMHFIKTEKLKGAMFNIDLSKAYDTISWLYIRLLLTHLSFEVPFIKWVMSCITIVSFAVLINEIASPFFQVERGIREGCLLSPLFFMLVVEGLSRATTKAKSIGKFEGIVISPNLRINHLLFVDDALIFYNGCRGDADSLQSILDIFGRVTRILINAMKSTLLSA
jgi:hypothetical protein